MEITPNGLQKELTTLLSELVFDTGFKKKKIGWLTRKVGECEQFFTITFTRDRGLPGNLYSVNFTLSFTYKEVAYSLILNIPPYRNCFLELKWFFQIHS